MDYSNAINTVMTEGKALLDLISGQPLQNEAFQLDRDITQRLCGNVRNAVKLGKNTCPVQNIFGALFPNDPTRAAFETARTNLENVRSIAEKVVGLEALKENAPSDQRMEVLRELIILYSELSDIDALTAAYEELKAMVEADA